MLDNCIGLDSTVEVMMRALNREGGDIRVKICNDCTFALRDGDVLVTCTLDNRERDVFLRHYSLGEYV